MILGRAFTPILTEAYKEINKDGKKVEIIYVPADNSKEEYTEYALSMPWKALPYKDPRCETISAEYLPSGIPTLIALDSKGLTIEEETRDLVESSGAEAFKELLAKLQ